MMIIKLVALFILGIWTVAVHSAKWSLTSDSMMMSFDMHHPTDNLVFSAGYSNGGQGSMLRRSEDNGVTWSDVRFEKGFRKPLFLWSSHFNNETTGVMGGSALILQTSIGQSGDGGKSFVGKEVGGRQRAESYVRDVQGSKTDSDKFYCVGQWMNDHGVSVSTDGGATFGNGISWQDPANSTAMHGAFPSDTTWYISGGHVPLTAPNPKKTYKSVLHKYVAEQGGWSMSDKGTPVFETKGLYDIDISKPKPTPSDDESKYYASIMKTTDGGKTFKQVFKSDKTLLGEIECTDENTCWTVAAGYGPLSNGIGQILHTTDGGETWVEQFQVGAGMKIVMSAITMLSPTEGWAAYGAAYNKKDGVVGQFLHTVDGGKTWEEDSKTIGLVPTACSFSNPESGWCCCLPAVVKARAPYVNYN